jgi:serine/threonine protein kinase
MAPEQLYGENVDRRTDVYSAGVVLWEMLVGQRMFDDSDQAALLKIAEAKIEPPSARVKGLSPAFDRVTMRALQKDRRDRYPTALEMAEALETCARVATRTEVRNWVERLAGEALDERGVKVANVEAVGDSQPPAARLIPSGRPGSDGGPELTTTRGLSTHQRLAASARRTRVLAAFGGGALLASLGFGAWLFGGGRTASAPSQVNRSALSPKSGPSVQSPVASDSAATASESQLDTGVVPVESLPYAEPSAAAKGSAPATKKQATARAPSKSRKSTSRASTRKVARPKPSKPKPNCDPPYTIDSSGTKRFKIECF